LEDEESGPPQAAAKDEDGAENPVLTVGVGGAIDMVFSPMHFENVYSRASVNCHHHGS